MMYYLHSLVQRSNFLEAYWTGYVWKKRVKHFKEAHLYWNKVQECVHNAQFTVRKLRYTLCKLNTCICIVYVVQYTQAIHSATRFSKQVVQVLLTCTL